MGSTALSAVAELNIIADKMIDMERIIRRVNDSSIVLASTEDINKWSIERAKRLGKQWHTQLDKFKKDDKLCRFTIFCDIIDIVKIFQELKADNSNKFLFECKKYLQHTLTEKSPVEKFNVAKVKLADEGKLHVLVFEDKYEFRDKVNQILSSQYENPVVLTRHHYDTIIENFNEHYKGIIEVYAN
jgi:hypothetical protein